MGLGLFGKVPQKRDFIAHRLPTEVLHPWENWLQASVSASRAAMSDQWQQYYLVAPIWRFWIGDRVLGRCCMGGLMASVDQVGRYFPLTLIHVCDEGEAVPPPALANHEAWFAELDARLLSVLADDGPADPQALLAELAPPEGAGPIPPGLGRTGIALRLGAEPDDKSAVEIDYLEATRARSYWWAKDPEGRVEDIQGWAGLPEAQAFQNFLRFPGL